MCIYIYMYKCMYAQLIMVKYTPCSSCGWNKSILEPTVQLDQGLTREHYIKRQQLFIPTTGISNFTYYEKNPEPFQNSHQICSKMFPPPKKKTSFHPVIRMSINKCPTGPSSSPTLVQASKLVLLRVQVPRPENFTKLAVCDFGWNILVVYLVVS